MSIKSGPPDKRPDCEPRPKKIILSKTEKKRFQQWVYENVDASDVPQDELNDNALIYNLIHLIEGDGDQYNYREDQDKEILSYAFTFYQETLPPPPAQPKKAMVDPSTLPDGEYPFQVIGGNMIKNGSKGTIILRFRFIHPDLTGINLDLPIITIQLGNIITPGPGPVPKNLIKKE